MSGPNHILEYVKSTTNSKMWQRPDSSNAFTLGFLLWCIKGNSMNQPILLDGKILFYFVVAFSLCVYVCVCLFCVFVCMGGWFLLLLHICYYFYIVSNIFSIWNKFFTHDKFFTNIYLIKFIDKLLKKIKLEKKIVCGRIKNKKNTYIWHYTTFFIICTIIAT